MRLLLFGLAAGSAWAAVFGDAGTTTPGEVLGPLGGVAGFGSLGVIVWFIKQHREELKETRAEFSTREATRDEMFNQTITTVVADFKQSLRQIQEEAQRDRREMREENQRNIDRQFEIQQEVVSALERVNTSLEHQSQHLADVSGRLKVLEGGGEFHQMPHYPPPGQNPQNPPQPPKPGGRR